MVIIKIIRDFVSRESAKYYMLQNFGYEHGNYNTMFKVNDPVKVLHDIVDIIEGLGVVEEVKDVGTRIDFTINGHRFSLFNYDRGVIES